MLETGTKAPEFSLPDQNGEMHFTAGPIRWKGR